MLAVQYALFLPFVFPLKKLDKNFFLNTYSNATSLWYIFYVIHMNKLMPTHMVVHIVQSVATKLTLTLR